MSFCPWMIWQENMLLSKKLQNGCLESWYLMRDSLRMSNEHDGEKDSVLSAIATIVFTLVMRTTNIASFT